MTKSLPFLTTQLDFFLPSADNGATSQTRRLWIVPRMSKETEQN